MEVRGQGVDGGDEKGFGVEIEKIIGSIFIC